MMTKIDHISGTSYDAIWKNIQEHVALPSSGPWGYQTEQHRRWHWLDYMIDLGAYPPKEDDWDWVYMLGAYADQANCVFYVGDDSCIHMRRRVTPPSEPDVE